jgi:hypothetical protein
MESVYPIKSAYYTKFSMAFFAVYEVYSLPVYKGHFRKTLNA